MQAGFPHIARHGLDALVVRFADRLSASANRAAIAFRAALEGERIAGVVETAPALASVFVRFDPAAGAFAKIEAQIGALLQSSDWGAVDPAMKPRLWRIPTVYGGAAGPQLAEAARLAGVSQATAIEQLSQTPVRVLAIGFAPGQPYLGELPENWDIPRQTGLTPKVPEGALVVAVRQFVLFANPSPTGWRHVGQTAFRCFRPEAEDPFPLRPGDEVLFDSIDDAALTRIRAEDPMGGGAVLERGA